MRKSVFVLIAAFAMASASCGKSECKKYVERFCADPQSPACADATAKAKAWNSTQCRIQNNGMQIEEQSKQLENELK